MVSDLKTDIEIVSHQKLQPQAAIIHHQQSLKSKGMKEIIVGRCHI